ncbi:MAG: hypothetical protein IIA59_06760 [Candidatus Marinimicrobia bacterium]|nr:hypothetical protein [Candidatus Neomarinimicrobiota bacterium]
MTAMVAVLAVGLSIYNIWYTQYKDAALRLVINKWTVLGLGITGPQGNYVSGAFLINVSIINQSNKSKVVKDILLEARDANGKTYVYNPVAIFDFQYYSANLGSANMLQAQKGIVPLPVEIPPKSTYKYDDYLLMLPFNKQASFSLQDQPIIVDVMVCEKGDKYRKVMEQTLDDDSLKRLTVGSFSAVESSSILASRRRHIDTTKGK